MLILARKRGERIRILTPEGRVIWIVLVESRGQNFARIGVEADKDVEIAREEVARPLPTEVP